MTHAKTPGISIIEDVCFHLQGAVDSIKKIDENNTSEKEVYKFKKSLSDLIFQLKRKNISLQDIDPVDFIDDNTLERVMDQMIQYAELDFSNKLDITGNDDVVNVIATTVNLLGEELADKIKKLQELNITLEVTTQKNKAKNQELSGIMKALDNSALILIIDVKGFIVKVNKGFCEASKYSEEELLGKHREILKTNFHPHEFWLKMKQQIENGKSWRNEIKCLAKDGSVFWIDTVVNPITNINGRTTHYLAISNLITDKKIQEEQLIENEKAIRQSLKDKELLLQEVHHRVKNNLQMISSLMELQIKRAKQKEVIEQLSDSQKRVKAMALLHEKLYQSQNVSFINISEYTDSLISTFATMYGADKKTRIQVESDIQENINLSIARAIPFGLIFNELVSNCYKHAFNLQEKGRILVSLNKIKNKVQLKVKDNGTGLDKNIDFKTIKSLGIKLITSLTGQLKADISFKNKEGLEVCLNFMEE